MKKGTIKLKSITFTGIILLISMKCTLAADNLWTRSLGDSGFEQCYALQETSDGGYILGGWTDSFGNGCEDMVLEKVDSTGRTQWRKAFGGKKDDYCESVQHTDDGGYILGGWTYSFGAGSYDVLLVKTDSQGTLEWQRTFGGASGDYCYSVIQTSDGGYLLGGANRKSFADPTDVYIIKTDSRGSLEWERSYGGDGNDGCYSIQQSRDGGYILAGDTKSIRGSEANYDMYLLKTDSQGNLEWQKTFGGDRCDGCYAVEETIDGGYILAGDSESFGAGSFDIYLVKTDSKGDIEWQKMFGGPGWDDCHSVIQDDDGGFVIAGSSDSFGGGDFDMYVIKTDSQGKMEWQKTLGDNQNQYAFAIQQPERNTYVLAGYTEYNESRNDDIRLDCIALKIMNGEGSKWVMRK